MIHLSTSSKNPPDSRVIYTRRAALVLLVGPNSRHLQSQTFDGSPALCVNQQFLNSVNQERFNDLMSVLGREKRNAEKCMEAVIWGNSHQVGLLALCAFWKGMRFNHPLTFDTVKNISAIIFNLKDSFPLHDVEHLVGYECNSYRGVHPVSKFGESLLFSLGSRPEGRMSLEQLVGSAIKRDTKIPVRRLENHFSHLAVSGNLFEGSPAPWNGWQDPLCRDAFIRVFSVAASLAYGGLTIRWRDRFGITEDDFRRNSIANLDLSEVYPQVYQKIKDALALETGEFSANLAFWRR